MKHRFGDQNSNPRNIRKIPRYPEDLGIKFKKSEAQIGAPLRTAMQQVYLGCAWGDGVSRMLCTGISCSWL